MAWLSLVPILIKEKPFYDSQEEIHNIIQGSLSIQRVILALTAATIMLFLARTETTRPMNIYIIL